MDSKLHNFQFQFLLLLWLWGVAFCTQTVPPNLTRAQWFAIQHIHPSRSIKCNSAMQMVNSYTGHCKGKNTFLHVPFPNAVSVCHTQSRRCLRSPRTNCHQSQVQVPLTDCDLTKSSRYYRNCKYKQTLKTKFFVIACDQRSPRDSPAYPVVPVHLDGTV
uniref:Ribonuclease A F1 n=1 Tax=Ochotona princeps TaxID=9978 RepID=W0UVH9_OCHPR|nr:TPA: ribonuclease A F1 [Ochotona princeps]